MALKSAEDEARRIRMEQAVLQRREEILRYELKLLEDEASRTGDQVSVQEAREELLTLLADERAAEERFRETLNEMWEAEGLSASLALGTPEYVRVRWPVEPTEGLSATFLDPAYERRFGIPHHAVDIPVEQGSAVRAAADGIVSKVVDNGLGYNYILVRHDDFATLYGHVNSSLVREGDEVWQGDTIALSGGRPGTPGAGALTTGPHVHFEVIVEGERIDPLRVLPDHSEVSAVAP
jgi:murein DD-endopeptidase MepM/ murein hydrolase activator NlpD